MGHELVKAALHRDWAALSPVARLVLCEMSLPTIDPGQDDDEREPRLYWAGHHYLVLQLDGLEPGESGYESALRKVRRAIAELVAAGAISPIGLPPRPGRRATYTVHPDNPLPTEDAP